MELNLIFKDQNTEEGYKNSQSRIHQRSFLILTIAVVLQSSGIYFSNPLGMNIFASEVLGVFFFGILSPILGYLLIRKKFPKHSDRGISIYVLTFIMCAVELIHMVKSTVELSWVYFLLGVNIQTGCLFLLLSRIRWTHTFFVISLTLFYSWFRVIDIGSPPEAQKTALISMIIHLFIFFTLSYTYEKELRISFLKVRADSHQLYSYDEIIKSVIESAVIIMKDDEVVFTNDATRRIFDIQNEDEVKCLLHTIQVVSKGEFQYRISNSLRSGNPKLDSNSSSTLYKHYKTFESINKASNYKTKHINVHKTLEGEFRSIVEESKTFAIQLRKTYWKGAESVILIMNDSSSLKNHFRSLDSYKDNLLATISHDLRTPLNGMLGILELLYEEIEEPNQKEKIHITITSAKLLLNMINDILDFSMISKGRLRLKFETHNIKSLVEETIGIMKLQAQLKGLSIEVKDSLTGEENYPVDGNRLTQVLLNLISNAIKYTVNGSIKVNIFEENLQGRKLISGNKLPALMQDQRFGNDEIKEDSVKVEGKEIIPSISDSRSLAFSEFNLDRKRIIFEVEDTGIGIRPDDIGRLFTLFSRVTAGHDRNMNGIGLGLAISQSLIKLMNNNRPGAVIKVTSEIGKGSKFYFPIYIDNEPSSTFKEAEGNSIKFPFNIATKLQNLSKIDEISSKFNLEKETDLLVLNSPKKKMIMIVDDDQLNILVATTFLKPLNEKFSFMTACNGSDALEKVQSFALENAFIDIFLMDCNMPIMDGYEASITLKAMMKQKIIPWAPIVAITANIASTDKEKCYESGMDLFLTKPYTKPQLLKMLGEAMSINGF